MRDHHSVLNSWGSLEIMNSMIQYQKQQLFSPFFPQMFCVVYSSSWCGDVVGCTNNMSNNNGPRCTLSFSSAKFLSLNFYWQQGAYLWGRPVLCVYNADIYVFIVHAHRSQTPAERRASFVTASLHLTDVLLFICIQHLRPPMFNAAIKVISAMKCICD